jgi:hypothetical protein
MLTIDGHPVLDGSIKLSLNVGIKIFKGVSATSWVLFGALLIATVVSVFLFTPIVTVILGITFGVMALVSVGLSTHLAILCQKLKKSILDEQNQIKREEELNVFFESLDQMNPSNLSEEDIWMDRSCFIDLIERETFPSFVALKIAFSEENNRGDYLKGRANLELFDYFNNKIFSIDKDEHKNLVKDSKGFYHNINEAIIKKIHEGLLIAGESKENDWESFSHESVPQEIVPVGTREKEVAFDATLLSLFKGSEIQKKRQFQERYFRKPLCYPKQQKS